MKPFQAMRSKGPATAGSADPYEAYVVFQSLFEGDDNSTTVLERKGKTLTCTGNAKLSTTAPISGVTSLVLDGTGDYVSTTSSLADFAFGTNSFTVEVRLKTVANREQVVLDFYTPSTPSWMVEVGSTGKATFYAWNGGATVNILVGTTTIWDGNPHRIAVSRVANNIYLHVDGVLEASAAYTTSLSNVTAAFSIGAQVASRNPTYDFAGTIDEVRITNGYGRYTGNYTPAPFAENGARYLRLLVTNWIFAGAVNGTGSGDVRVLELDYYVGSTIYPTPAMTSNVLPVPLVASSSGALTGFGDLEPYRVFTHSLAGNQWQSNGVGTSPRWLTIDLGAAGNAIRPTAVQIAPDSSVTTSGGYYITGFKIQGSNTGAFAGEEATYLTVTGLVQANWTASTLKAFYIP